MLRVYRNVHELRGADRVVGGFSYCEHWCTVFVRMLENCYYVTVWKSWKRYLATVASLIAHVSLDEVLKLVIENKNRACFHLVVSLLERVYQYQHTVYQSLRSHHQIYATSQIE